MAVATPTSASELHVQGWCPIAAVTPTADCNGNGVPDAEEVVPKFQTAVVDAAADGAVSVFAADLDGDGDGDVLSAIEDLGIVAWYENLGGQVFGPRRMINANAGSASQAIAADLDGDGDLDVLYTAKKFPLLVAWHENLDGSGTFSFAKPVDFDGFMQGAMALAVADVEGSAGLEILAVSTLKGRISWYANAGGTGTFTPKHTLSLVEPRTVVAADLNDDTWPDLLTVSVGQGAVLAYKNTDGFGGFELAETLDSGISLPRAVEGADLDGDGDQDALVAAYGSNLVSWYENMGGPGAFGPRRSVSAMLSGAQVAIGADLDGDGDQDVVAAAATGTTAPGPAGTCCAPGQCVDVECYQTICQVDSYCCVVGWDDTCAAEALADPDCSVACGGGEGRFVWFENLNGTGTFGPGRIIATSEGAWDVFAADLDGDGDQDLVTTSYVENEIAVRWNQTHDCNGNHRPDDCDIAQGLDADADCDGVADSCDPDGGVGTDCNGNAVPDACDIDAGLSADCTVNGIPDECETDCNANGLADACDLAGGEPDENANGVPDTCDPDCNGNGVPDDLDIAPGPSVDCDGNLVPDECQGDCDGNGVADACDTAFSFTSQTITQGLSGASPLAFDILAADMDGDGDQDVVAAFFHEGFIAIYSNVNGLGTVWSQHNIAAGVGEPRALATADVDGDGDLDVFAVAGSPSVLYWYENDATMPFTWIQRTVSSSAIWDVAAADFDGDGDIDAVSNGKLFKNVNGLGTQWIGQTIFAGGSLSIHAVDIDGDDDPDLASASNLLSAWYVNNGSGSFITGLLVPPVDNDGAQRAYAGDLDGDGDADILVGTGSSVAWYENQTGIGDFGYPSILAQPFSVRSVFAADLDGDADRDVLYVSGSPFDPSGLKWVENLGSGLFGPVQTLVGSIDDAVVTAADLDGDGDQDPLAIIDLGATVAVRWFKNGSDDCDGNSEPDACQPDCDADGLIDHCALSFGVDVDCNANALPDNCDASCTGTCDADGDRCRDPLDGSPANPLACADTDADGCDDCTGGSFDPAADGTDGDDDGYCWIGDCAEWDATVWSEPSAAGSLLLAAGGSATLLDWKPPLTPGGMSVLYDVLRSSSSSDFLGGTVCVESDGSDLAAADGGDPPAPGTGFYYLVRAQNGCPGSTGNLGTDSSGEPRSGLACP